MTSLLVPGGSLEAGARLPVEDAEAHHLRVRRTASGERVRVLDGAGTVGLATLSGSDGRWEVRVDTITRVAAPEPLLVLVGAGDRDRFGWLVEKATEFGATAIVAVETSRSVSVGGRVRPEGLERLRRRALETLKQCGGAWAPEVIGPVSLGEALRLGRAGGRWIASASVQAGPPQDHAGALAILVGPEGGFTGEEHEAALAAGWRPVRLARSTLRYETAAIAALAVAAAARVTAHPEGEHR